MNFFAPGHRRSGCELLPAFPPAALFSGILSLVALVAAPFAPAATITQTTADTGTQSSLVDGTNWSDGQAPGAANDYVSAKGIRTPAISGSTTFAGNSLTLNSGGSILFKGTGTTSAITISNLQMNGTALVSNYNGAATYFTLAGSLSLGSTLSNGLLLNTAGNGGGFEVSASISGAGKLKIYSNGTGTSTPAVTLSHANNSYSGGTLVTTPSGTTLARLIVTADGALGSGDLTIDHAKLTLTGGLTNNYISNAARLIVSSGLLDGAISLDYTGNDLLAGISLDGGTSFLEAGTYSSSQLNTLYGSNAFSGLGTLQVVPEPSPAGLALIGMGGLAMILRTFRRRA